MNDNQPVTHIPASVIFFSGLLVAIHLIRELLPGDADRQVLERYAFIPQRYSADASYPGGELAEIWTFITYAFLHGGMPHLVINVLWFACFGTALARRFGLFRLSLMFVAGSIGGAFLHLLVLPDDPGMLIGASAGISAVMAGTLRFAFVAHGPLAGGWGDGDAYRVRAPGLIQLFANRRASTFILVWLAINLAIGLQELLFGAGGSSIAWQAHIGGFVTGLLLFPLLDPARPAHA